MFEQVEEDSLGVLLFHCQNGRILRGAMTAVFALTAADLAAPTRNRDG